MSQQIVHNNGTNFSLYYNVLNFFKTITSNHPSIEHVSQGSIANFDTREFPKYPIANIQIIDAKFGSNITSYTVELIVADKIKNKNNESENEYNKQVIPFYGVDDTVDIHANTLGIINDLTAYTQRGVAGFDIIDDIECIPFEDRFNNGLAGWQATFTLVTHNDKNRCLFFLINPSGSGYIIEDCDTGERAKAVLRESGSIGQVFATKLFPNTLPPLTDYLGLKCYTIVDTFEGEDDYDYVNLPILYIPLADFEDCELCKLWTSPQVMDTTQQTWGDGPTVAFRQWAYD
jgi:hypothetical protein